MQEPDTAFHSGHETLLIDAANDRRAAEVSHSPNQKRLPAQVIMAVKWLRCVANGGRWLLPWASVLMLSGAVADTAGQALVRSLLDQSPPGLLAAPAARAVPSATLTGVPHNGLAFVRQPHSESEDSACFYADFACSGEVVLSSVDARGIATSLTCLTTADRVSASLPTTVFSADVLSVRSEELDTLVSELCLELRH